MATPNWQAAFNGTLNDGGTRAQSAQINQFLGAHANDAIYTGVNVLSPNGTGGTNWGLSLSTTDADQPFTLSGTSIGRVQIPLLAVGNGADLLVSLCADNAGVPGSVLVQTRLPKEWITQLSAVVGAPGSAVTSPNFELTNNPLALAQFYGFQYGTVTSSTWPYPTGSSTFYAAGITSPGFFVALAGVTVGGSGAASANTYSVPVSPTGVLSAAIPEPPLPQAIYFGAATTIVTDSLSSQQYIVFAGGSTTASGSNAVSTTYVATFTDATGDIGSWSSQTTLPTTNVAPGLASWNGNVYLVGGDDAGGTLHADVYVASMQNGQLGAWTATTSLPIAIEAAQVFAANGFLYVSDGIGLAGQITQTWYAPINADGTLGNWVQTATMPLFTGASTPSAFATFGQYGYSTTNNTGKQVILSTGPAGPDFAYMQHTNPHGAFFYGATPGAVPGSWYWFGSLFGTFVATVYSNLVSLTPRISVPLPITGLTNGGTYHILLQQQGGDAADYLLTHLDTDAFPGNPTALTSPENMYTWTALTPAGTCVPLEVYDFSAPALQQLPLHTWEDNGAKISTLVSATTPDQSLLGICEAVNKGKGINRNPGFEFTVSPWATSTGALVRSSTQAYDSNWSAQMTPNGTSANVFFQSELLPCLPGQSVTVDMRVYAVNAITGNFSATLFWYNAAGTFLSESDNLVSVPAAAWTRVTNTFTAPSGAYQFSINPRQSGTPPVGNVFYVDDAYAYPTYAGEQYATVGQISYTGVWPNQVLPPTGLTQLA